MPTLRPTGRAAIARIVIMQMHGIHFRQAVSLASSCLFQLTTPMVVGRESDYR